MNYNKIDKVVFLKYLVICLGITSIYLCFYTMKIESAISINDHAAVARHIISLSVIVPVVEEVVFRKLLLKLLKSLGQWKAVILSAIIFGLCHLDIVQKFYTFALGVILAIIALKYGTIKYGIMLHMIINLMGVACVFISIYVFYAICIIITVLSIIIIKKDYKELFNLIK